MATDTLFPFYELLVESVFGGIGIAIFAMGIIFAIILMVTRTSRQFTIYWVFFYLITMATFYFGGIALVFGFLITFSYFIYNFIKMLYHDTT
jgi:hypothetical protein